MPPSCTMWLMTLDAGAMIEKLAWVIHELLEAKLRELKQLLANTGGTEVAVGADASCVGVWYLQSVAACGVGFIGRQGEGKCGGTRRGALGSVHRRCRCVHGSRGTGSGGTVSRPESSSQSPMSLTGERPGQARSTCQWPPRLRHRVAGTARRGDRNREVEDGGPPAGRERRGKLAPSTQISSTQQALYHGHLDRAIISL
jgi:hypothetical protein